jgi:phosphoesterase RecJ-like protein
MSETAALSPPSEPSREQSFESTLRLIRERDRFVVTSHRNPEGDAIGSSLGLGTALIEMGKQVIFYNADPVPRVLRPFPHADRIVNSLADARRNDTVIVCDCGELERVGEEIFARREEFRFVNLDHHVSSKGFAEVSYIDPEAPATSLLVYRILRGLEHPISTDVATNLLCGLVTDTGSFRYSNATPEAFEAAAELTRRGARPDFVSRKLFDTQEERTLRLLALVLGTLEVTADGRIASVVVEGEMFERTGTKAEHLEEFVNYPRRIEGVELAVLLREQGPAEWKVSLRGQGRIDTTRISCAYGGGGHRNASGCTVRGALDTVKREIYARGEALLQGA